MFPSFVDELEKIALSDALKQRAAAKALARARALEGVAANSRARGKHMKALAKKHRSFSFSNSDRNSALFESAAAFRRNQARRLGAVTRPPWNRKGIKPATRWEAKSIEQEFDFPKYHPKAWGSGK